MRLPGAALLITIGLFILWIAVSGDFKKLAEAWDYVRGNTQALGKSASNGGVAACDPSKGICDFSNYHVSSMLAQPDLSANNPGGLL